MNSEDKIYNKIRNASHKGEKDFPGMDKVWNRVEEKLDNTIVVQKKNTWQKLAIAATVLLSFSIIYQFVSNDETIENKVINNNTNPIIVSNDSVKKIIDKAKEVVVDNSDPKKPTNDVNPYNNFGSISAESNNDSETITIDDSAVKMALKEEDLNQEEKGLISNELNRKITTENDISFRNSALNFSSSNSNNGYLAPNKKYEAPAKDVKSKYRAPKLKSAQQNKDLVVIDGVAMDKNYNADKELAKLDIDDITTTVLTNPLYIINGVEYTEESLFGKNPTSPYAPLDKQKITSTNILQPADATKIYGKKGEKGIVIITTKDGKPAEK